MSVKKSVLNRANLRVKLVDKYKNSRREIVKQLRNSHTLRENIQFRNQLRKLPRDSAACRIRNRCTITGRSRAYNRKFGLARAEILRWAYKGLLYGWKDASW